MDNSRELIYRIYHYHRQLHALRNELTELEEESPRRVYELRQAKVALTEYDSGNLTTFFHKLVGKYDDKKAQLESSVHAAQQFYDSCKQRLAFSKTSIASIEADLEELPTREELFNLYPNDDYLKQQDVLFCLQCLLPLLDETYQFLISARDWAENRNADFKPLGTQYEKSFALKKASECAVKVRSLMEQIVFNGFTVEIHPYFYNPDGFIATAARQFGQQDRINYAISAVSTAKKTMQELLLDLDDE